MLTPELAQTIVWLCLAAGVVGAMAYDLVKDVCTLIGQALLRQFRDHPALQKRRQQQQAELEQYLISHPHVLTRRETWLNEELKKLRRLKAPKP